MNALPLPAGPGADSPAAASEASFVALSPRWLPALLQIENQVYSHPWSESNFHDSLRAGYQAQLLVAEQVLLGYFVAMQGVDEVHLLNLTVAPAYQGQGWARLMLQALRLWARGQGAQWLWLEVRDSNARARAVYAAQGFVQVGLRKNYYPAAAGQREDALVLRIAP